MQNDIVPADLQKEWWIIKTGINSALERVAGSSTRIAVWKTLNVVADNEVHDWRVIIICIITCTHDSAVQYCKVHIFPKQTGQLCPTLSP